MVQAVMALNNCEAATPARIVRSLPPRAPLVSKATKAKAAKAPAKAPAEREIAPAPRPSTTIDTAPVEAPAETPRT